eukprot:m.1075923 g.1075923  ORF g.1075923 m.1075923 type:complete len:675 (-) comp24245_c0_seq10:781-2805(-)
MSRRASYSSLERLSMYAKSSNASKSPTTATNPARTPSPGNKNSAPVSPSSTKLSPAPSSSSLDNSIASISIPEDESIPASPPPPKQSSTGSGPGGHTNGSPTLATFLGCASSKLKVRRTSSLARLERAALLPASAASADRRCTDCQEPYDAFGNILYKCARCDNDFCHMCVPQRPQQNSYVRLCLQCYKNIRGISRIRKLGEGGAEALVAPSTGTGRTGKDAVIAGFEAGLEQIRQQQRFDDQESSDLCYMLSLKMSSTLTSNRKDAVAQALARTPEQRLAEEIAIYIVLPVNILSPLVEYFQAEEDREVEQLSRWYDAKKRRLEEKIRILQETQQARGTTHAPNSPPPTSQAEMPVMHTSDASAAPSPATRSGSGARDGGPYVVSDAESSEYPWLHPDVSRRDAEDIVCRVGVDGAWLVRRVVDADNGASEHVELVVNHGGPSRACHVITRSARSRALRVGTVQVLHRGGLPELITALSNPPNDTTTRTGISLDASLAVTVADAATTAPGPDSRCPHQDTSGAAETTNSVVKQLTPPWLHRAVPRDSVLEVLLDQGIVGAWLVYTPSRIGVPDDTAEIMVDTGGSVPTVFLLERSPGVQEAVYRVASSNSDTSVLQHIDGQYDSIIGFTRALTEETAGVAPVLDPTKFVRQTASRDVIGDILSGNTDFRYDEV